MGKIHRQSKANFVIPCLLLLSLGKEAILPYIFILTDTVSKVKCAVVEYQLFWQAFSPLTSKPKAGNFYILAAPLVNR